MLEGGFSAGQKAKLPTVPADKIPKRDGRGRTVWVTRARPKIDRIACPWLIRRFIDPAAVFLFVAPSEVEAVGERFDATPFDIENVLLEPSRRTLHLRCDGRGVRPCRRRHCSGWRRWCAPPIPARLDLSPEAPGLLAASLGLSRMFDDDLEQLSAGMMLYDAFYRWCRDATGETHNWPTNKVKP